MRKFPILLLLLSAGLFSCGNINPSESNPSHPSEISSEDPYEPKIEEEFIYSNFDYSNHTVFNSGNYIVNGNSGSLDDPTGHNSILSTDINVESDEDFSFKAKVNVSRGTLHLAFGIQNDKATTGWYGLLIEAIGVIRFSSEGCGTIGAAQNVHAYSYNESEKIDGFLDLELRVFANGEFEAYLNNKLIINVYDSSFNGGRFGFANWECAGEFKDVTYAIRHSIRDSLQIKDFTDYDTLRFRSGYYWNNWRVNEDSIVAANRNRGDEFCMSTIHQEPNQNLIFKAHIQNSGRASAIAFGVTDISHPTEEGWYGFTYDREAGNVRGFAVNKGTIGSAMDNPTCAKLSSLDLTYGADLKIIALASGYLFYYLNDELITVLYDSQYNGGYLGFNTCDADATFSDMEIQLSTESSSSGLNDISFSNFEFNFDRQNRSYRSIVKNIDRTQIKILADKNHDTFINGEMVASAWLNIEEKDNYVCIMSKDKRNSNSSFTVINVKKIFDGNVRPMIHFTTEENWINDPNGLVYDEVTETYHAFFQYSTSNLQGAVDGWYHATSKDLCHWENKGLAICSNNKGLAWSGGGFVDFNNTSGLFNDNVPEGSRLCCVVTYHSATPKIGLCYSLDHGETWLEAPGYIIDNSGTQFGANFRDPKIIWYENEELPNGGIWLMITGGWEPCRIFSSSNLINWKYESVCKTATGGDISSECPDMLIMNVDDNPDNVKYVLSTGGTSYYVGNIYIEKSVIRFKAVQGAKPIFTSPALWSNVGDFYATQGFVNDKYGRNILVSWMVDRTCPLISGKDYNGVASLPLRADLIYEEEQYVMLINPVEEIEENAHGALASSMKNLSISEGEQLYIPLKNNNYDANMVVDVTNAKIFQIRFAYNEKSGASPLFEYNVEKNTMSYISNDNDPVCSYTLSQKIKPINGKLNLRLILDSIIFDCFANGGRLNMHGFFFARTPETSLLINAFVGDIKIDSLNVTYLK